MVERARARWEDEPKHPAHVRPAPPARRRTRSQQGSAQAADRRGRGSGGTATDAEAVLRGGRRRTLDRNATGAVTVSIRWLPLHNHVCGPFCVSCLPVVRACMRAFFVATRFSRAVACPTCPSLVPPSRTVAGRLRLGACRPGLPARSACVRVPGSWPGPVGPGGSRRWVGPCPDTTVLRSWGWFRAAWLSRPRTTRRLP